MKVCVTGIWKLNCQVASFDLFYDIEIENNWTCQLFFPCSRPVVIPPGQAQRKSKRHTFRSVLAPARIVSMGDDTEVARCRFMRVPGKIGQGDKAVSQHK